MPPEYIEVLLSAAGGGLMGTWGMLRWTNGRIRRLELDRVTPDDCRAHVVDIGAIHKEMWTDIKRIAEAVARIEGHLGANQ